MIEKKTMGYVDFSYPSDEAKVVTVIVNTETNEVELFRPTEKSDYWSTPGKYEHFFPTVEEAKQALENHKRDLIAKMPEVRSYLQIMASWLDGKDEDNESFKFDEDDFLPDCYQPDRDDYYLKQNIKLEKINGYLKSIIRTGFINIKGESFKVEDVKKIKWGKDKAELILKDDTKVETGNNIEFDIIKELFGFNHSGFTYVRLNNEKDDED